MKIAVCVPVHGEPKARFCYSLARMLIATQKALPDADLELFMLSSSMLPQLRTIIAEEALKWGAEFLLWIDADHTFPEDTLLRLLAHEKPVVGLNFVRKLPPHTPTSAGLDGRPVATTAEKAGNRELEPVLHTGLGLCLLRAELFRELPKPWFRFELNADGSGMSEDTFLFQRLREAGVGVFIDHALSRESGHIGEAVFTHLNFERRGNVTTVLPSGRAQ